MGYLSRLPDSNDQPQPKTECKNPWLDDNDIMDEVALRLNGLAKSCTKCRRATHIRHLDGNQLCPDCR